MQDLRKMSVKQLCDAYVVRLPWDAVVAEITRRIENAATHHGWRTVPPEGHVRLPDGRDVELPQDLLVLFRIQADTEEAAEAARAKEDK